MRILTASEIREVDRKAMWEQGLPSRVLMERAGEAVFALVRELLPAGGSIGIVCGKGNNGGDGLVVARLTLNHGYYVDCVVAAAESEISPESAEVLASLRAAGCEPSFAGGSFFEAKMESLSAHDLLIDAVLGIGAKGQVKGFSAKAIQALNGAGVPIVSVDVPSGIECDSGQELGMSVIADWTVTFGYPKPFLFEGAGADRTGEWRVADIGYPSCDPPVGRCEVIDGSWVANQLPLRSLDSNKGKNGHVLIVAGSHRMRGAATLAALAALRAGAGLVTVASVEEVCAAVAANLPEVLLMPIPMDKRGSQMLLDAQASADAGLFGPGLTHEPEVQLFLANVFAGWDRPALVDADALNAVSQGVKLPDGPCLLTPHPGEAGRLLGCKVPEIQSDRFGSARELAAKYGKAVLLKGRYGLVAGSSGQILLNTTGNPGLATGGTGDTLSGIAGTLMAQGMEAEVAGACALHMGGLAADECAKSIGSVGYLPTEIADALPSVRDHLLTRIS